MTRAELQALHRKLDFGVFLHFGMSTFNDTEWADAGVAINTFNPTALNIEQWAKTIKRAKARYAVLTAKHMGGFCLWNTATTTYNITQTSWYASHPIDIVDEFCKQMRAFGIVPYLYFSNWDPRFESNNPGYTQEQYLAWNEAQITELLTNYGTIGGLWMDGAEWHFNDTPYPWATRMDRYNFIKGLQENCVFINNDGEVSAPLHTAQYRLDNYYTDVVTWEANFNWVPDGNTLPAEQCDALMMPGPLQSDVHWFWHTVYHTPRTADSCFSEYDYCRARNSNLLLDCPPDRTGQISAAQVTVLASLGNQIQAERRGPKPVIGMNPSCNYAQYLLNGVKTSQPPGYSGRVCSDGNTYYTANVDMDADGYPRSMDVVGHPGVTFPGFNFIFVAFGAFGWNPGHGWWIPPGDWVFTFEGEGYFNFQHSQSSYTANRIVIYYGSGTPMDYNGIWLEMRVTNPANPPKNWKLYNINDEQDVLDGRLFRRQFLDKLRPFKTIRFMDWNFTNANNESSFANRGPKSGDHFSFAFSDNLKAPVEYMVALCNELDCNLWFNVPPYWNDDDVLAVADLIKNGRVGSTRTWEGLKKTLDIYVEYFNECWNYSIHPGWMITELRNRGTAMGYTVADTYWSYCTYRQVRSGFLFRHAFSDEVYRIKSVLAAQCLSGGGMGTALMDFSPHVNGGGPSTWDGGAPLNGSHSGSAGDYADVYAVAPYFGWYPPMAWTAEANYGLDKWFGEYLAWGSVALLPCAADSNYVTTTGTTSDLRAAIGSNVVHNGDVISVNFHKPNGGTITFTANSPNITWTGSSLKADDRIMLIPPDWNSSMPPEFSQWWYNVYWVLATGLTANTFQVSATQGGTAITPTTAGGGRLLCYVAPKLTANDGTAYPILTNRGEQLIQGGGGGLVEDLSGRWNLVFTDTTLAGAAPIVGWRTEEIWASRGLVWAFVQGGSMPSIYSQCAAKGIPLVGYECNGPGLYPGYRWQFDHDTISKVQSAAVRDPRMYDVNMLYLNGLNNLGPNWELHNVFALDGVNEWNAYENNGMFGVLEYIDDPVGSPRYNSVVDFIGEEGGAGFAPRNITVAAPVIGAPALTINSVPIALRVLDYGLNVLAEEPDKFFICSARPTTYGQATSTFALGSKTSATGSVFQPVTAGSPSGRKTVLNQIDNGTITATGTASHWGVVDSVHQRLLLAGQMATAKSVNSGGVAQFQILPFSVTFLSGLPDLFLSDYVLQNGLQSLPSGNQLNICSQLPSSLSDVTSYSLGFRTGSIFLAPEDDITPTGRKVRSNGFTSGGSATANGTATHWAVIDATGGGRFLASGAFVSGQSVTQGATFSVSAFTISVTLNV